MLFVVCDIMNELVYLPDVPRYLYILVTWSYLVENGVMMENNYFFLQVFKKELLVVMSRCVIDRKIYAYGWLARKVGILLGYRLARDNH
jgi:hypothetical protein